MTDWITIKHEKAIDSEGKEAGNGHGGTAVVPAKSLKLYEKKGWKKVDEASEPPVTPALKAAQSEREASQRQ